MPHTDGYREGRRVDASRLPAIHEEPPLGFGCMLLPGLFPGLGFVLTASFMVYRILTDGRVMDYDKIFDLFFAVCFGILGLIALVAVLYAATAGSTLKITEKDVSIKRYSAFGSKTLVAPLKSYEGIRLMRSRRKSAQAGGVYSFELILAHPDSVKTVNLFDLSIEGFRSETPKELDEMKKYYCRCLNLPFIEGNGVSRVSRTADEIDKSLAELGRDNKLDPIVDALQNPPRGLNISHKDQQFRIITSPGSYLGAILFFIATVVMVIFSYSLAVPPLISYIGAAFGLLIIVLALFQRQVRSGVILEPKWVRVVTIYP